MTYENPLTQLLARVQKQEDGCWLWQGGLRSGYGRLKVKGRLVTAHRLSYEVHIGPIPEGMLVCHTCDVRNCVNPAHFFLGTYKDNSDDKWNKGRANHTPRKQFCQRGHSMADAYITPNGKRMCRTCKNANWMAMYRRKVNV